MTRVVQQALRAALLGRQMVLIRALLDNGDEAAMRSAIRVWAHGEQSEIRLSKMSAACE